MQFLPQTRADECRTDLSIFSYRRHYRLETLNAQQARECLPDQVGRANNKILSSALSALVERSGRQNTIIKVESHVQRTIPRYDAGLEETQRGTRSFSIPNPINLSAASVIVIEPP